MKKIFYLFTVVLGLLSCTTNIIDDTEGAIAGIHYPITEKGEDYTITYKFKESTIVYDDKSINYIHHIEADTIIYFEQYTPTEFLPSTGDIVSTRISEKTPFGLGNKVISITKTENFYKCTTTSAALNEIYDKLDFVYDSDDISKLADNMEIFGEEDDVSNSKSIMTRGKQVDKKFNIIEIDLAKLSKRGMVVSGKIELTGKIHAEGSLENNNFEYYFEPKLSFNSKMGIGVEYKKNLWQDIDEFKNPFFTSPKADLGPVPLGPLVLRPYIAAEGYVDFNASGNLTVEFDETVSTKFGYKQQSGGYFDPFSYTPPSEIIKGFSIDGNAGLKFKGVFDVGLGVYVKDVAVEIDPYFSTGIGLNFRQENLRDKTTMECVAYFDVGGGLDAKFVVDFFGKLRLGPKVNLFDNNVFRKEWPLIPMYEKNSMCIAGAGSPGNFDGNYIINSGFLGELFPVTPAVNIYDSTHKLIKCQKMEGPRIITEDTFIRFNLSNLNNGGYFVHPCLVFKFDDGELPCESEECYEINGKTSVEILSVRQTSYKNEIHNCSDNCGVEFYHTFTYDVDIRVTGAANCIECGYCVDYIHDRRAYYNVDNVDGDHTISNGIMFSTANPTLVIYPYAKYSDGRIEVGEPFSTQFSGTSMAKGIAPRLNNEFNYNNTESSLPSPLN